MYVLGLTKASNYLYSAIILPILQHYMDPIVLKRKLLQLSENNKKIIINIYIQNLFFSFKFLNINGLWCLMSHSTIFQLYHGSQFYRWGKHLVPTENVRRSQTLC